jgi:hypothetical protein
MGGLGVEAVTNMVIFTVLIKIPTVLVKEAKVYAMEILGMTGCVFRKESAISISAKQNLSKHYTVKAKR